MMRSMYAGVSGLKTHQTKMDVIGNNIANVNTVAYKSSSITFSELMYQTTQKSSGANTLTGTGGTNAKQIGLGTKSGAISTAISSQGATQTTGNPFDLCITGESFFIVSDGSSNYFTRAGAFNVDSVGNLVMSSNGYNVMGWGVDQETQTIKKDTVQALRIMSADNLTSSPEATSKGYLSGILDKNDTDVATDSGKKISLSFYDSLGYSYTAKFSIHNTDNDGEYYVELDDILDSNGVSLAEIYDVASIKDIANITTSVENITPDSGSYDVTKTKSYASSAKFNSTTGEIDYNNDTSHKAMPTNDGGNGIDTVGNITTVTMNKLVDGSTAKNDVQELLSQAFGMSDEAIAKITAFTYDNTTGELTIIGVNVQGSGLYYNTNDGSFKSIGGNDNGIVALNFNESIVDLSGNTVDIKQFSDIEVDWSSTNMYNNSGTSTISATSGDKNGIGMGRKLGNMSGVTIQTNGMIYASYDNGTTKLLGQIAVAEFTNAAGLEKAGDNLYQASLNSGEFDGVGVDISGSGGYMTTGVLEMSNVDLSAEFTEMITTQRGFQANSRVITVSDTMLEELVNLKR